MLREHGAIFGANFNSRSDNITTHTSFDPKPGQPDPAACCSEVLENFSGEYGAEDLEEDPHCHCLSMQLNCLTGLALGIISIVMILPITCMFCTSVPLSLVFPRSLRLALGQRLSRMYCISYCYLTALAVVTLEGLDASCLPSAY